MGDLLVILCVVSILGFAIHKIIKQKNEGACGGCHGCSGCHLKDKCKKQD